MLAQHHAWAVSQSSCRNFYPPLPSQQPNDSSRLHTPLLSVSESNCGAEVDRAVKSEHSPDSTYHTRHGPKKKLRFTLRCEVSRQHILKKILGGSAREEVWAEIAQDFHWATQIKKMSKRASSSVALQRGGTQGRLMRRISFYSCLN